MFNKEIENSVYQSLLSKNSNAINEEALSQLSERLRMLWLQRTDRLNINESEKLICIHERFSYSKLPLPVPFEPKYGQDPISFGMSHSEAIVLIKNNIREWFTNKYRMENPTFWGKILMKVFSKD